MVQEPAKEDSSQLTSAAEPQPEKVEAKDKQEVSFKACIICDPIVEVFAT